MIFANYDGKCKIDTNDIKQDCKLLPNSWFSVIINWYRKTAFPKSLWELVQAIKKLMSVNSEKLDQLINWTAISKNDYLIEL